MKPKINIDREPISSEEILSRKNFSAIITGVALMTKPFYKTTWFLASAAVTTFATVAAVVYFNSNPSENSSNETIAQEEPKQEKTIYTEDSPCIHPPIEGLERKFTTYTINIDKGGSFTHPGGTVVTVPAKSLNDENGKPVTGEVEFRYREFHDQADLLLSGIPMTYDSAGTQYTFESAGMLEIYAYQNGKPLQYSGEEKMKIEMASRYSGNQYNVYELDTTARNWVYLGKDQVTPVKEEKSGNAGNEMIAKINPDEIKKDPEYKKLNQELSVIQKEITQIKIEKPVEPKAVNPNKYNFNLDVDPKEFPELTVFGDMRFEVGQENKGFSSDMYNTVWDDAKLLPNRKGINYNLTLVKGSTSKTITVYPVYEGASLEAAQSAFNDKMNQHNSLLQSKEKEETLKKEELKKRELRWENEIKANNVKIEQQRKISEQHDLIFANNNRETGVITKGNLAEYGLVVENGVVRNVITNPTNSTIVTRTFQVAGFGAFNCDSPQALPGGAAVSAIFVNKVDEKPLSYSFAFLVEQEKNMYYSFSKTQCGNFKFDQKHKNVIIIPLADGRVAYMNNDNLAAIDKRSGEAIFYMEVTEKAIRDEDQIREILFGA